MATSISLHSPADVPELVRNSVMGCVDRTGEQSPSATRWMYGFRSSYDTTGTLARKVARPVSPASWPHLVRYSAPALRPRISERTRSCTASTSEVSSSMSRSFSTSASLTVAAGDRRAAPMAETSGAGVAIVSDETRRGTEGVVTAVRIQYKTAAASDLRDLISGHRRRLPVARRRRHRACAPPSPAHASCIFLKAARRPPTASPVDRTSGPALRPGLTSLRPKNVPVSSGPRGDGGGGVERDADGASEEHGVLAVAAEAELSSARIVLESIKEEGLRFTTSIERTRRETARVTDEIPRLTEQEKAASAQLLKARSRLEAVTAADERADETISKLAAILRQLEDDAEAAEKEKTLTETENRRAMSDAENIDAEIAAAEQRIRESVRELGAARASEAAATARLKAIVESATLATAAAATFEYEYLTGRAEVVHAVAEMKAAAAEAWTEARRTSEEIAMRAEAIERELGEASAADAEVTNTPRRPVEARGSGSAATTRMEKSRRMSSSSKPRAPSSNVKRKRRVLTLNCLKLLAGKCRGQN
ncbi:hypothetical protein DAI22_07g202900 [Oryza sativa Japonica Group]|nr:hypothetical protein DAI22_07g202900 [Oryza sativa Japonica Group]